MTTTFTPAWLCALSLVVCACTAPDDQAFTQEDLELIRSMALDPVAAPPVDISNDLLRGSAGSRKDLAVFGQQLFFDRELSADGGVDNAMVTCTDCHSPAHHFSDPRAQNNVSRGLKWTDRNSPSLVNVGYYVSFGWDGRADSLWGQGMHAYSGAKTMGGTKLRLSQQLARRYPDRFRAVFGLELPVELTLDTPNRFTSAPAGSPEAALLETVYTDVLKAWGAYELRLVSGNAPFDRFARGDAEALDPAQRRGLHLFLGKAGCVTCHLGPLFTDNQFHALGVRQHGVNVPDEDLGRFTGLQVLAQSPYRTNSTAPLPPTAADRGRFRTKSLRQVAETAPYFHAGQAETLDDVVWFYNQGGEGGGAGTPSPLIVPLHLDEGEQADLVAFLGSLTGEPVPAEWRCDNSRTAVTDGGLPLRCASTP